MDSFAWRDKLSRRAAHKALNIPLDDVIQANRINSGVTWKEIAAGGAVLAGLLGAGKYLFDPPQAPSPAPAAAASDTDTDTITDLEFVEPAE